MRKLLDMLRKILFIIRRIIALILLSIFLDIGMVLLRGIVKHC